MKILVTGSAGYIGSHAALQLLDAGHEVLGLDDYTRGNRGATATLESSSGFRFIECGLEDRERLTRAMAEHETDAVLHFAALAYVGESVTSPLRYYRNNVAGSLSLLAAMSEVGVRRLVFSSTCATYGEPASDFIPIAETCPQSPINPYGRSKWMVEHAVRDFAASDDAPAGFGYALLRYFNVAGSDPAARVGEDHRPETHLIPICLQAALGQRDGVTIFGTDYPTPDGTCVRDYVHVDDLIRAHVQVLESLSDRDERIYNVGSGVGFSVREVVDMCREVTGIDFPASEGPRRPGDPPVLFADPAKISRELQWKPERGDLRTMVEDAWRWLEQHPNGYDAH